MKDIQQSDDLFFYDGKLITFDELVIRWPGCTEAALITHIIEKELRLYHADGGRDVFGELECTDDGNLMCAQSHVHMMREAGTNLLTNPFQRELSAFKLEEVEKIETENPSYLFDYDEYERRCALLESFPDAYVPPSEAIIGIWEKAAENQRKHADKMRLLVTLRCSQGEKDSVIAEEFKKRNIQRDKRAGIKLGQDLGLPTLPMPPERSGKK